MQVYLTARHLELTDALRAQTDKLVRAVERHAGGDVATMEIQLYELSHRADKFGCHVRAHVPEKHEINVREESGDLYAAVDLAENRLLRELVDFREKRVDAERHPKKFFAAAHEQGAIGPTRAEDVIDPEPLAQPED
jgi:ribosomal subunit interface protein